ncbi:MAG TPA: hypothetical protein VE262_19120 [Blastocatellia bacterium]|nr:hypothetical protein [Blastocatellia bacterium]
MQSSRESKVGDEPPAPVLSCGAAAGNAFLLATSPVAMSET